MVFSPNDSPLAGREGAHLTGSKIGERLAAEAATSVSLRVVPVEGGGGEAFEVQARGELQLGLLIGAHPPRIPFHRAAYNGGKVHPWKGVLLRAKWALAACRRCQTCLTTLQCGGPLSSMSCGRSLPQTCHAPAWRGSKQNSCMRLGQFFYNEA